MTTTGADTVDAWRNYRLDTVIMDSSLPKEMARSHAANGVEIAVANGG